MGDAVFDGLDAQSLAARLGLPAPGGGLWMTLVERPASPGGIEVLSLRVGLYMAEALDALADERVRLKWPNDLFVGDGKLAGILIEARWRDQRVEWVAIGVGVNVVPAADVQGASGLAAGVSRLQALDAVLPALRAAAGVVAGISTTGELMVDTSSGPVACRTGSLVFAEDR